MITGNSGRAEMGQQENRSGGEKLEESEKIWARLPGA